ncbi:MAG TPA: NHL repeat-containing protein [Solirubrobacterales bacterium]|nr:NHL repeat-containing protein [Solirubrobacterales bacterium]
MKALGERDARTLLAALCASVIALSFTAGAQGATDPLFVFTPLAPPPPSPALPPPTGSLSGPCGLAVDSGGSYYVSDYYHHTVDIFSSGNVYSNQLANEDPQDGPCGLALDATNRLYVNNYHRNVVRFNAAPSFGAGSVIAGSPLDSSHPTGVAVDPTTGNVFVNQRTYIAVYDSLGNPVFDGAEPLKLGLGSLGDGYGIARSQFAGTLGRLYVPDAATNTVKVYDPLVSKTNPVAEIKDPFNKAFSSLRDSAVAVDRVSGDVYFSDDVQPTYTERPQATIYIYSSTNTYKGHLKYNVINARPAGLAVDNSTSPTTQGRVYVTSGNTDKASIYAYGPGSGTTASPLPPLGSGLSAPGGSAATTTEASAGPGTPPSPAAGSTASTSTVTQEENLRVSVDGKLSPKKLPREGSAPISVTVGWQIATTDGSPPPRLKELGIEINREGHFDYTGLPVCPLAKIQPATTQRALSNCKSALVGQGSFSAEIALKGQEGESYATSGRLLVFNGEAKGKPVLFAQIYAAHPFATSFVITFAVSKIKKGAYGTALTTTLPKALRSWGNLTAIKMKLSRRYGFEGKRHSYLSAGCPAPKGFALASFRLARTAFSFNGGKELESTVAGDCRVRG